MFSCQSSQSVFPKFCSVCHNSLCKILGLFLSKRDTKTLCHRIWICIKELKKLIFADEYLVVDHAMIKISKTEWISTLYKTNSIRSMSWIDSLLSSSIWWTQLQMQFLNRDMLIWMELFLWLYGYGISQVMNLHLFTQWFVTHLVSSYPLLSKPMIT